MQWMDDALCREIGGELFFIEENPNAWREAKKVCSLCKVQYECLEYALGMDVDGVWGGTTKKERMKLKKVRAAA